MQRLYNSKKNILIIFSFLLIFFIQFTNPNVQAALSSELNNIYQNEHEVRTISPTQGIIENPENSLLYWVQASDIHILMEDVQRKDKFDEFCNVINNTIKPSFVISSGDNLDGVGGPPWHYFLQDEAEFRHFNQTLEKYGFGTDFWFPVLGNHDSYNTKHNKQFWYEYMRNETQYAIDIETNFGNYRFIMLDDTHEYGLKTLYNLFGEFKQDKLEHFKGLINSGNTDQLNQTILFSHHPTNEIFSEKTQNGENFYDLVKMSNASVYLNGHLHYDDLFVNRGHFSELHCPSFKNNYRFRICVLDNDNFAFSDVTLNDGPYIVITNPTDARFYNDNMNIGRMKQDSTLRALIIHDEDIDSVYAEIDGKIIGNLTDDTSDNLWKLKYNTSEYREDFHTLKIYVQSGDKITIQQLIFNLNGEVLEYSPNNIVWWYYSANKIPLFLGIVASIFTLIMIRIFLPKILIKRKERWSNKSPQDFDSEGFFQKHFAKRYFQSSQLPKWVNTWLFAMGIISFFGPQMIGEFADEVIGVQMLIKVYIDGTTVYTALGVIIPLLLLISVASFQNYVMRGNNNKLGWFSHIPVIIFFLFHGAILALIGIYFNTYSIFLSPILYINVIGAIFIISYIEKGQKNNL